jgi:hypothetical protein
VLTDIRWNKPQFALGLKDHFTRQTIVSELPSNWSDFLLSFDKLAKCWEKDSISNECCIKAFQYAARALEALANDKRALKSLELEFKKRSHDQEANTKLQSLDSFLFFLEVEKQSLTKSGVNGVLSETLINQLSYLQKDISSSYSPHHLDAAHLREQLLITIERLKLCITEIKAHKDLLRQKHLSKSVMLETGGWGLILVNGSKVLASLVAGGPLGVPLAGYSIGSALGGRAILAIAKQM